MPTFQPGKSGNPTGRPSLRDTSLGDMLRLKVMRPVVKARMADVLIALATKGKSEAVRLQASRLIFELIEGKPAQRPAAKTTDDGNMKVIFQDANDQAA